jgi:hypothetical protein
VLGESGASAPQRDGAGLVAAGAARSLGSRRSLAAIGRLFLPPTTFGAARTACTWRVAAGAARRSRHIHTFAPRPVLPRRTDVFDSPGGGNGRRV